MSNQADGPGWWQASDGRWYPPQGAAPAESVEPPPPAAAQPEWNGAQWTVRNADGSTSEWDGAAWVVHRAATAPPDGAPASAATAPAPTAPAPTAPAGRSSTVPLVVLAAVVVLVLVIGAAVVLARRGSSDAGTQVSTGPVSGPDDAPSDQVKLAEKTVVVKGNGGSTLKSVADDGTTFVLDGKADGVDRLAAGSVLLLTGVTVVKVTDVQRAGDDVTIKTEPAAIGDVIADADLSWKDMKANAGALHVWEPTADDVEVTSKGDGSTDGSTDGAPDGSTDDTTEPTDPDDGSTTTTEADTGTGDSTDSTDTTDPFDTTETTEGAAGPTGDVVAPGPRLIASTPLLEGESAQGAGPSGRGSMGDFKYEWSKGDNGGSTDTYHLKVTKDAGMRMVVEVDADVGDLISEGHLKVERSVLNALEFKSNKWEGKATAKVEAAVGDTKEPIQTTILQIPISVDYPIVIYGIPFNLNVQAKVLIEPAFSSKSSSISGQATVTFGGNAGLTYQGGTLTPQGAITAEAPDPISYVQGLGIGVNGMIVAAQIPRLGFGLGFASTNAGVFLDSVTSIGITAGSNAAIVQCFQITVTYTASAGAEAKFIGVDIPGLGRTKQEIYKKTWSFYTPKVKACELEGG